MVGMHSQPVILHPGKEKAIKNRHHWIFSGAIKQLPDFSDGDFLSVQSAQGELLGSAYFNRSSNIIGRMVSFDETPPLDAIKLHLDQALALRKKLFKNQSTTAYRLVNGEGDLLPGLVIDRYEDVMVMQLSTLGMDRLRSWLITYLIDALKPKTIYEKSALPTRKQEGLEATQGVLYGDSVHEIILTENGLKFVVNIAEGQKTGFFLDQREMRQWIKELANGKKVLNCFGYSGAFSVYARAGKAQQVDTVDISDQAIQLARHNMQLNDDPQISTCGFFAKDAFQFLREHSLSYDLVILDPPAFAKRQKDVVAACRGYKDINRLAMQKMPETSLLLTSSCSYYVNEELFQKVLFQAAIEANRTVRIIGTHRLAADHPINICHPESHYLKSFLLLIE